MKKIVNLLSYPAVACMVSLFLSLPAHAQHNNNNGGGNSSPAPQRSSAPAQSSAPRSQSFTPRASYSSGAQRSSTNNYQRSNNNYNRQNTAPRTANGITQQRTYNNNNGHVATGFNTAPRTQTGAAVQTRSYAGSNSYYGHNHTGGFSGGVSVRAGFTARGNTYYHYNHGYYASYYAPRLGFSLGVLPYGYYPFYYGDYQYFYSGGLFYQYDNDQYTVVEPPVGAEVKTLPSNAQSIVINGQQYYEADGVYYEPITKDDGTLSYQVAGKDGELNTTDPNVDNAPPAPQIGDIVTQLPPNCRKISVNGSKLYLSPDGIYYQAQVDRNGNATYKIVGLPENDDQNQPDQTSN